MKSTDLLFLAGAGVLAYVLLKKSPDNNSNSPQSSQSAPVNLFTQDAQGNIAKEQITSTKQGVKAITSVIQSGKTLLPSGTHGPVVTLANGARQGLEVINGKAFQLTVTSGGSSSQSGRTRAADSALYQKGTVVAPKDSIAHKLGYI